MSTNTHPQHCVSMGGGSTRGTGGPGLGCWSSELSCALLGTCDGNLE